MKKTTENIMFVKANNKGQKYRNGSFLNKIKVRGHFYSFIVILVYVSK